MSCNEIPEWFLRRRIAVVDLKSAAWHEAQSQLLPPGYTPGLCLARLEKAGHVRRLGRGVYQVLDPVRETPPIAVASGIFAEADHYVTTDAALAVEGLIDQPLVQITVVLSRAHRNRYVVGKAAVRPVSMSLATFVHAERVVTSMDGFRVQVATRAQAIVDALAEPRWMAEGSLLPEVLDSISESDLEAVATRAGQRSIAAAQRLGFLLDEQRRPVPAALAGLRPRSTVELRPGVRTGTFSTRWRVYG